jgi:hypothetical protein
MSGDPGFGAGKMRTRFDQQPIDNGRSETS